MSRWEKLLDRYRVSADPLRTERRVELLMLALLVMLLLQLMYSGARLASGSSTAGVAPAQDLFHVTQVYGPAPVGAGDSEEIRSRPVFWKNRRPVKRQESGPERGEETAQAGALKELKLLGVFGSGEQAGVIVRVKGKKRRIFHGESVEGWTLESVEPNAVTLGNGKQRETLVLKQGTIVASAPQQSQADASTAAEAVPEAGRKSTAPANTPPKRGERGERRLSLGGRGANGQAAGNNK